MVHEHMSTFHPYSMAHLRITSYWALVAKKQYSVIFEIYIMKRCCFSLGNECVARLTGMETGWAVCIASFSVPQHSRPCYLIDVFKNVKCLFSCCQYAKTAKSVLHRLDSAFIIKISIPIKLGTETQNHHLRK